MDLLLYALVGIAIIFISLNIFVRSFQRDSRLVEFADTLPGPRTVPFLGSYKSFYFGEDSLKTTVDFLRKYGHVYKLWFGKHLVVGLSNVEDLETVFMSSKMVAKPKMFQPYHDIWGDGLFTASVNLWRKNRRRFYCAFANDRFDIYTTQINDVTRNAISKMQSLINEREFNAWDFFVYLSFNVITRTMLDVKEDFWDSETVTKFHQSLSKAQQISFERMCVPWFHIKFIDDLFYRRQLDGIIDSIFQFSRKVVNYEKYGKNANFQTDSVRSFVEIVRELLSVSKGCDEKIACDEIYTVISGGTNTNASVISFFLIAIAIHQDIQDKLYHELYDVFGDDDRDGNQEDIRQLPYLDQVLKESLRRFTIAPFILREVQDDSKIGT
ncbi:cytochrome P450 4g15-like isoform X2 [Planococcus citri]|uniref:cytochrome P450 4g15-like isoform X2 n=1 Tax=Planococcus citri TaxID=170843 RepID=UPI0031F835E8